MRSQIAFVFFLSSILHVEFSLAQTGPRYSSPGRSGGGSIGQSRPTTGPRQSFPQGGNRQGRVEPRVSNPPRSGRIDQTGPRQTFPQSGNRQGRVEPRVSNPPRNGRIDQTGPRTERREPRVSQGNPNRQNGPVPGNIRRGSRPRARHYGTPNYHRPYGHTRIRYSRHSHIPYGSPYAHTVRYHRSLDWYQYVFRFYPNYVYANWIFFPAVGYSNGYWTIDNYPYYVFNGYRYRYSTVDYCNYQLVDQYNHQVVQTYWNQPCHVGYDTCSYERDILNDQSNDYRYFCSETFREDSYDYSIPTYENRYNQMCHDPVYDRNCR